MPNSDSIGKQALNIPNWTLRVEGLPARSRAKAVERWAFSV